MANTSASASGPIKGSRGPGTGKPPTMLGFELESLQPIRRMTTLDLDARIFPSGIRPGSVVEIRGPSGSGKTFLMTYLLARLLLVYPEKTVVLFDTNQHFSFRNLKSILSYFDPEVIINLDDSTDEDLKLRSHQKFLTYVNRISHVRCFTPAHFLSAFGPECSLDTMLLTEPNLSLILIDSIDCFSFTPELGPFDDFPNLLKLIKMSVEKTRTPVLCSMSDYFPFPQLQPNRFFTSTSPGGSTNQKAPPPIGEPNIIIDPNLFTMSLVLTPNIAAQNIRMERQEEEQQPGTSTSARHLNDPATNLATSNFECTAHLRSRHSPKTLGFSDELSHRVKFSIFSGMLYTSTPT